MSNTAGNYKYKTSSHVTLVSPYWVQIVTLNLQSKCLYKRLTCSTIMEETKRRFNIFFIKVTNKFWLINISSLS